MMKERVTRAGGHGDAVINPLDAGAEAPIVQQNWILRLVTNTHAARCRSVHIPNTRASMLHRPPTEVYLVPRLRNSNVSS